MRFLRTRALQLGVDSLVVIIALMLAYAMRFEGMPPRHYAKQFLLVLPYLIILRIGLMLAFGTYRLVWRYVSLRDLPRIMVPIGLGTAGAVAARFLIPALAGWIGFPVNPRFATVPFGVLAAEMVLTATGIVAVRTLWRVLTERADRNRTAAVVAARPARRQKALLIGAGAAGVMVAREVKASPDTGFEVAGFLDDDKDKHGTIIQGHKVLGGSDQMGRFAAELEAELAIITIAKAPAKAIRRLVEQAEQCGLKVQIIPGLYEILSGRVSISKIRDVAIEDLLGREPVQLDEQAIGQFVSGKVVLVTGAGGSIGSEICRQVARFRPRRLLLLDQAENPVFHIHRELVAGPNALDLVPVIGSVVDRERMIQVMRRHRPEVVFHAAAHKHVPLMEANPAEAIRNNVAGSRTMADLAHEHGVDAFVMISTDKAVNPTSVMGATKRLAEVYVQALATRSNTRFTTVRFGNVLGSEGSVVPLFKEQIARGGPVTVTDPEMKRYFMTIPEASQLVLQAASMGQGGEIFILEMGEPILIKNLARDLIRLSGYRPGEDIAIEYTGIRPGEKLYEEINLSDENASKTKHPRIWVGANRQSNYAGVDDSLTSLVTLAIAETDPQRLRCELAARVPEYRPAERCPPADQPAPRGRTTGRTSRPVDTPPESTAAAR